MACNLNKIFLIGIFFFLFLIPEVSSSHDYLTCENFSRNKVDDCEYILDSVSNNDEEQRLLWILFDQYYGYNKNFNNNEEEINIPIWKAEPSELEKNRMLLAFRIFVLLVVNYCLFSVLTKPSFVRKWLVVD